MQTVRITIEIQTNLPPEDVADLVCSQIDDSMDDWIESWPSGELNIESVDVFWDVVE